jgi:flavin reductase (DIM6/NTAB) family NADH-FMN oxidoreductase RutF
MNEESEVQHAYRAIDPGELEGRDLYFLMLSVVVPRPIAWISTVAPDGTMNLAPHSFTTILSANPAIVCFVSVGIKDSMQNARDTGDFVYNLAGQELLGQLNITAANMPRDESEFRWAGLTPISGDLVRSPRVAEAPVSLEAELLDIQQMFGTDNYLVAGKVVRLHLAERLFTGDRVDPAKLLPIGRLSGSWYSRQGELVSLKRPTYQSLLEAETAKWV